MHITQPGSVFPAATEGHRKELREGIGFGIFRKLTKFEPIVRKSTNSFQRELYYEGALAIYKKFTLYHNKPGY